MAVATISTQQLFFDRHGRKLIRIVPTWRRDLISVVGYRNLSALKAIHEAQIENDTTGLAEGKARVFESYMMECDPENSPPLYPMLRGKNFFEPMETVVIYIGNWTLPMDKRATPDKWIVGCVEQVSGDLVRILTNEPVRLSKSWERNISSPVHDPHVLHPTELRYLLMNHVFLAVWARNVLDGQMTDVGMILDLECERLPSHIVSII